MHKTPQLLRIQIKKLGSIPCAGLNPWEPLLLSAKVLDNALPIKEILDFVKILLKQLQFQI